MGKTSIYAIHMFTLKEQPIQRWEW